MGESQAGEIVIHPNNRFIYSSNRTHDSIALFHRNLETGYLKLISCTSCLGKIPRFIELGIDGKQLFVANEESDTINIFSVDEETGELRFSERTIYVGSPVCIIFK
ncbi:6-phosphogluconolactonase [bioreactor metagenome]|uniref:6-phosphogluconolactonase n=1 Tax=bioreactor metagenome TaxID=1076179 RepID=A0A645JP53_9ZZZZ